MRIVWVVISAIGTVVVGMFVLLLGATLVFGYLQSKSAEGQDPPSSLSFTIAVSVRHEDLAAGYELHLDPADVDALDLTSAVVEAEDARFKIDTTLFDTAPQRTHCLLGPARAFEQPTGMLLATVPAGTCLGRGVTVPTERAPQYDATPEYLSGSVPRSSTVDPEPLTGPLAVSIDGCSTIAGRRVFWPYLTSIDDYGRIRLYEGRLLTPGEVVTVTTRAEPTQSSPEWCPGVPVFVHEVR